MRAGIFVRCWSALRACWGGDCFFRFKSRNSRSPLVFYGGTAWSCEDIGFVARVFPTFTCLDLYLFRNLADAHSSSERGPTATSAHLRAGWVHFRRCFHLQL